MAICLETTRGFTNRVFNDQDNEGGHRWQSFTSILKI